MRIKNKLFFISMISMLVMTLGIFMNPYHSIARGIDTSSSKVNNDKLYNKFQAYRNEHKIEPIDARVDKIWKAIPGYNRLDVDVKASYEKVKKSGNSKKKVVFKEISPNVHLEDLDSAPIYRGNPQKPMVALLINVAWGNDYIPTILKILNDFEVKATLGITPKWFAPPSGSFNQVTVQVAEELNMKTILWTVDTVDWRKPQTEEMVKRIVKNVDNGSMVLMHPTKPVAEGLGAMITGIKAKGYQLGTVSDLMSEKRVN